MKRFFVLTAVFVVLVSMGYAASPLVNTFMDPDIPAADHAVLSVDNNLAIATIDGQMTLKSSGSGSDGLIVSKTPIVLLTPGEHIIDVQYVKRTSEYSYWNNTTRITTTTTNFIKLTGNFEGGRFYRIYPRVEGKNVYFNIIDETDPAVWENERERAAAVKRRATEQKELAKAKYPKKTAALIVFQKAAAAAPTPLEGTYVLKDNPDLLKQGITEQAYTFTGQSWVLIMTKNFTDRELKMQNMLRKVLKEPPLTESTGYPGMRGTVELDGNTLTMVYLQMSGEGSYWLSNPGNVQMKVAFEYSFDSEGNLLLSYKGQAPLTYVRKN